MTDQAQLESIYFVSSLLPRPAGLGRGRTDWCPAGEFDQSVWQLAMTTGSGAGGPAGGDQLQSCCLHPAMSGSDDQQSPPGQEEVSNNIQTRIGLVFSRTQSLFTSWVQKEQQIMSKLMVMFFIIFYNTWLMVEKKCWMNFAIKHLHVWTARICYKVTID